jgi:hypothetical protein
MPVAHSPAHYINSSKGCPSITESFPLVFFFVLCTTVAALPVVQPNSVTFSDSVAISFIVVALFLADGTLSISSVSGSDCCHFLFA